MQFDIQAKKILEEQVATLSSQIEANQRIMEDMAKSWEQKLAEAVAAARANSVEDTTSVNTFCFTNRYIYIYIYIYIYTLFHVVAAARANRVEDTTSICLWATSKSSSLSRSLSPLPAWFF